jgi:hypothetical protein
LSLLARAPATATAIAIRPIATSRRMFAAEEVLPESVMWLAALAVSAVPDPEPPSPLAVVPAAVPGSSLAVVPLPEPDWPPPLWLALTPGTFEEEPKLFSER